MSVDRFPNPYGAYLQKVYAARRGVQYQPPKPIELPSYMIDFGIHKANGFVYEFTISKRYASDRQIAERIKLPVADFRNIMITSFNAEPGADVYFTNKKDADEALQWLKESVKMIDMMAGKF